VKLKLIKTLVLIKNHSKEALNANIPKILVMIPTHIKY